MGPLLTPALDRARRSFRSAAVALLLAGSAAAADPAVPSAESDQALAVRLRSALAADPQLAGLNPLVSVRDRTAVIGGPVPDDAAAARMAEVARKVPGLTDVKVSCWVAGAAVPLARKVEDRLRADPQPPPAPPVVPPAPTAPPAEDRRPTGRVTVQRMTPSAGGAGTTGFLLDPVAADGRPVGDLPMPAPASLVTGYPTIPPTAVPVTPVDAPTVEDQLAELRKDPRFARLGVRLDADGRAVIRVPPGRDADGWALAARVRKLPGVRRVEVE